MRFTKFIWIVCLILSVCLIVANYSFACEECVQTDDGANGCQGGHDIGHNGCSPSNDGSSCTVAGSCGLKSIQ